MTRCVRVLVLVFAAFISYTTSPVHCWWDGKSVDDSPASTDARKMPHPPGIIGGSYVNILSYPFMAVIRRKFTHYNDKFNRTERQLCGGTIITRRHVMTAAHCIQRCDSCGRIRCPNCTTYDINTYTVSAGRSTLLVTSFSSPIRNAYVHPRYNENCFLGFDIAVVELEKTMTFGPMISSIKLAPPAPLGTMIHWQPPCTIVGWGRTTPIGEPTGTILRRLKAASVSFLPNAQCHQYRWLCYETSICSYSPMFEEEQSACKGDSGGPLICGGVQVGVTSYGDSFCTNPSVYTRVDVNVHWIRNITSHRKYT